MLKKCVGHLSCELVWAHVVALSNMLSILKE